MARGWESKAVEAQQEAAASGQQGEAPRAPMSVAERDERHRRETVSLARAQTIGQMALATHPRHVEMLQQALAALDRELGDRPS